MLKHKETLLSRKDVVEVLLTPERLKDHMRILILRSSEKHQLEMLLERGQHLSQVGPELDKNLNCLLLAIMTYVVFSILEV